MNTNTDTLIESAALVMNTKTGSATYSPEDNKLRLYVGRVPREEYLRLRNEGWTSTPKQSCDFVATWTPQRRDTALEYADLIEDEDQSPSERAIDRAERFSEYRDKRTAEATSHADRFDAGPCAHGFQNAARAERAVQRHDRIGSRAVDAWSKAEYWQRRTAGVISHALYVSSPSVRMGRIKTIETELRSLRARWTGETLSEYAAAWINHLELRLSYENQMLEAQGGRLASVEIVPGGRLGGKLIVKVCKSPATGRVTSVFVKGPRVEGYQYRTRNVIGADYSLHQFETERLAPGSYIPPTPEDLAELAALEANRKAAQEKAKAALPPCPLINPTNEDAERLQAIWNARKRKEFSDWLDSQPYAEETKIKWLAEWKPSTVCRITQKIYSANSKGDHARAYTRELGADCELQGRGYNAKKIFALCQIRTTWGNGESHSSHSPAPRVIVLTDKPQKPIPAKVWEPILAGEVPA